MASADVLVLSSANLLELEAAVVVELVVTEFVVDLKAIIGEIGGGTCLPTNL